VARQSESPGLEFRRQVVPTLALPTVACKPPEGAAPSLRSENNHSLSVQNPRPGGLDGVACHRKSGSCFRTIPEWRWVCRSLNLDKLVCGLSCLRSLLREESEIPS